MSSRKYEIRLILRSVMRLNLTVFLLLSLLFFPGSSVNIAAPVSADSEPIMTVTYLYSNPCESCQDDTKMLQDIQEILHSYEDQQNLTITLEYHAYRLYQQTGREYLQNSIKQGVLTQDDTVYSEFILIGTVGLAGRDEIRQDLAEQLILAADNLPAGVTASGNSLSTQTVRQETAAPAIGSEVTLTPSNESNILLLSTPGCENCLSAEKLVTALAGRPINLVDENGKPTGKQTVLHIHTLSIADPDEFAEIESLYQAYHVMENKQQVPMIILGQDYLSGLQDIRNNLETMLAQGRAQYRLEINTRGQVEQKFNGFKLAGLFTTGVLNGLNPCAISMLLFFLSLLLAKSQSILKYAVSYILGKYVAYLLLGTLAYRLLGLVSDSFLEHFQGILKAVLVVILLLLASGNILDFLASRKEKYEQIRMQLPQVLRKFNHDRMRQFVERYTGSLLIISFFISMVIALGEFLCTGQIYLATILYVLHETQRQIPALIDLIIYITGMVLPLILIVLILNKSKNLFILTEKLRLSMPAVKLFTALFFLSFAALTWFVA